MQRTPFRCPWRVGSGRRWHYRQGIVKRGAQGLRKDSGWFYLFRLRGRLLSEMFGQHRAVINQTFLLFDL
jgi:hypothetical protein